MSFGRREMYDGYTPHAGRDRLLTPYLVVGAWFSEMCWL